MKELLDPLYLGLHMANFIVLAFFLRKLLYKPVKKLMDKRNELVAEQQKKLMDADADIERKKVELEASMTEREEKMQAAQAAAMAEITEKANAVMQKAHAEAEELLVSGRANIEREHQSAVANLDVTIAELAVEVAGKLISTQLTQEEQKALIEQGIREAKSFGK